MEETDLQVSYRPFKRSKNDLFPSRKKEEDPFELEQLRERIKCALEFMDEFNIHIALDIIVMSFEKRPPKLEFIELVLETMVELARERITKLSVFGLHSFFCTKCGDIIRDPVTLKCGHTFSKKCVVAEAEAVALAVAEAEAEAETETEIENDCFTCLKCDINYSFSNLTQLKIDVTLSALIDKLYESQLFVYKNHLAAVGAKSFDKIPSISAFLYTNNRRDFIDDRPPSRLLQTTTPSGYRKKGDQFSSCGDLREAFKAYMISYALEPTVVFAKIAAAEILRTLFQYPCLPSLLRPCSHDHHNFIQNRALVFYDCKLKSSGSSDSLHEEGISSDDEMKLEVDPERSDLHSLLDNFFDEVTKIAAKNNFAKIDVNAVDSQDFECPLCMRLLLEPITTECGHTFCRACLLRSFDHQPNCPLCKAPLVETVSERSENLNELLDYAIKILFRAEYEERKAIFLKEMEALSYAGKDPEYDIPLFVCTVALPTVPCLLHVFEPRYRLMIRQCMESGGKQFGMCCIVDDNIAEYGTILEIKDVEYFEDGRSIVKTVGRRRFRILKRGEKDGYCTATVEYIEDQEMSNADLETIEEKHDRIYQISSIWFEQLPADKARKICEHFGPIPAVEANYAYSPNGPSWLWWFLSILPVEPRLKVLLISLTSLPQRLELFYRILLHFYPQSI